MNDTKSRRPPRRDSTVMRPYVFPTRDSSLSPPPPPPKPRPQLSTAPPIYPSVRPLNTKSPVRRKPLPSSASSLPFVSTPTSTNGETPQSPEHSISSPRTVASGKEQELVFRDLDRFPRGATPLLPAVKITPQAADSNHSSSRPHFPPAEPAPAPSPPRQHILSDNTAGNVEKNTNTSEDDMALKLGVRPPPLRMDSASSVKSLSANDAKKPQTPGGKVSSFFGWKRTASPSTDSLSTENSDSGRSPGPSPFQASPQTSAYSSRNHPGSMDGTKTMTGDPVQEQAPFGGPLHRPSQSSDDLMSKIGLLEGELREISSELAGSIRREMELEDLVERLQLEGPSASGIADRTSDYFSDSGTSSIRPPGSDAGHKDSIDRIKRDMEQQRALQRVDLSQKWQDERTRRKALESHVQILEAQISASRRTDTQSSDLAAKTRELEVSLDDARRRLTEERQTKENFEDLLAALRVELEQHRNERDNLKEEVVPQLRSTIEGLESTLSDSQKSTYDVARMQQEIKKLKEENAALTQRNGLGIHSIMEDEPSPMSPTFNLARSNSRATLRGGLSRSGSVSRQNTVLDSAEPLTDKIKSVEQQRDALHSTVKALLRRQDHQSRQFEKRMKVIEMERDRAITTGSPHKHGYEREVRGLRSEINLLRKRADDALEQKWQCEKGLGGLAMDLDRSKQETSSLRKMLQARDGNVPGSELSTLQQAYDDLQRERRELESRKESARSIAEEQKLGDQLQAAAERSEALLTQVKQQLQANSSLRSRLREAVERGEQNQQALAEQINELQTKLRRLEDTITAAQTQSETAVMKHEEEIRVLRASHNAQLLRAKAGIRTPGGLTPGGLTPNARSPLSPLFTNSKRSPKLDKTTTGPGMALHQALKTEYLEHKVAELEKALSDTEKEMGEVVSRMNTAQIGVAELQSERDEALRQTRKLEAAIMAERQKVQSLGAR